MIDPKGTFQIKKKQVSKTTHPSLMNFKLNSNIFYQILFLKSNLNTYRYLLGTNFCHTDLQLYFVEMLFIHDAIRLFKKRFNLESDFVGPLCLPVGDGGMR